jgi:dihydrofolate reductase
MKVQLIVAMDNERGIGKNNDLMWHLPADMKFFKETTVGHIVVMGRKNFDSIPERFRPLVDRENVVLTRNTDYLAENCQVFHSLEACLKAYENESDRIIFIIGGGQIYQQALALNCIDELYITHVNHVYGADTFFPEINVEDWSISTVFSHPADEKNAVAFQVKHYTKK